MVAVNVACCRGATIALHCATRLRENLLPNRTGFVRACKGELQNDVWPLCLPGPHRRRAERQANCHVIRRQSPCDLPPVFGFLLKPDAAIEPKNRR